MKLQNYNQAAHNNMDWTGLKTPTRDNFFSNNNKKQPPELQLKRKEATKGKNQSETDNKGVAKDGCRSRKRNNTVRKRVDSIAISIHHNITKVAKVPGNV